MSTQKKAKGLTNRQSMVFMLGGVRVFTFDVCSSMEVQDDGTLEQEHWIEDVRPCEIEFEGWTPEPPAPARLEPVGSTAIGGTSTALRQALHVGNRKN